MEQCMNSVRNKQERILALVLGTVSGLAIVVIGLYCALYLATDTIEAYGGLFLIFIGLAILSYFIFLYAVTTREYKVAEDGITIRYFRRFETLYPWSSITEIVLCETDQAPKDASQYDTVIRILAGRENKSEESWVSVLSGEDNWKTGEYQIKHFRKVLLITCSEPRLEEIKKWYHAPIPDLRKKKTWGT